MTQCRFEIEPTPSIVRTITYDNFRELKSHLVDCDGTNLSLQYQQVFDKHNIKPHDLLKLISIFNLYQKAVLAESIIDKFYKDVTSTLIVYLFNNKTDYYTFKCHATLSPNGELCFFVNYFTYNSSRNFCLKVDRTAASIFECFREAHFAESTKKMSKTYLLAFLLEEFIRTMEYGFQKDFILFKE